MSFRHFSMDSMDSAAQSPGSSLASGSADRPARSRGRSSANGLADRPSADFPAIPVSVKRPLPEEPRIVIVRFSSLGDVVKATGLPRQIRARYPKAHLTMVTAEAHLPLIADNPHLNRAIGFDRQEGLGGLRRLADSLRRERVDLMVDIHRSLRSRLLAFWVGAPGVAYSKRTMARWLLIRFGWNTYRHPRRKEIDFAAALAPYGVIDDGLGPELHLSGLGVDPNFLSRLAEPLARIAALRADGRPLLGLAPVAAWELKRWPLASFSAVAERFISEMGGGIVVFGGAQDADARDLAEQLGPGAISLVGQTSLLESAYFAGLTDLFLANDTGMAHLTEAVGRDVMVLFGPTSEELGYFPARPTSQVLQRPLPCRPCTRMGEGRCSHPWPKACLEAISVDSVLGVLRIRLAAAKPRQQVVSAQEPDQVSDQESATGPAVPTDPTGPTDPSGASC